MTVYCYFNKVKDGCILPTVIIKAHPEHYDHCQILVGYGSWNMPRPAKNFYWGTIKLESLEIGSIHGPVTLDELIEHLQNSPTRHEDALLIPALLKLEI